MPVKLFGHTVSTPMAVAVGGGSLLAIWFAWKQHSASSAASSSAVDPVTGLPASQDNTVDPQTGMTYLAEAQQYGSVQAAEQTAGQYGGGGASAYGTYGTYGGAQSTVPANVTQAAAYGSNAAWAQAVEAGLADIGYSPTDIAAALGRYLGNLPETSAQAGIVQAALAEYGDPPVGSYHVIMQPAGGTGSGGGKVKVPRVEGLDVAQASQVLTSAGFKVHGAPKAVKGVTHVVTGQHPAGGSEEAMGTAVTLTWKSEGGPAAARVTVPAVTGLDVAQADLVLGGAGLKAHGPAGVPGVTHVVTGTAPAAGAQVTRGTTVTLHYKSEGTPRR